MKEISVNAVRDAVERLCIEANRKLPCDIECRLHNAAQSETNPLARSVLGVLEENLDAADRLSVPICQDTGMAVVFLEIGQDVHFTDGSLYNAVNEGVRRGYVNGLLRKSVVADPIRRGNTDDNTPAVIHTNIVDGDTVKITVYEKTMAGYVEYMDRYFYFDNDGTVVESSDIRTLGIPQIKGLEFDHIVLLEKLPVEDDTIFNHILDISQLLDKYGISAEQIYFDRDYQITLYFGQAKIKLGGTEYIDEKIMKLKMILPSIEDKKGTLRMENYTADSANVTFELEE